MNGMPAPFSPLAMTLLTPSVTIGASPAAVSYSGLTPGAIGLYQVNATVPTGVPAGGAIPVVLSFTDASANKANSNIVTIAVR